MTKNLEAAVADVLKQPERPKASWSSATSPTPWGSPTTTSGSCADPPAPRFGVPVHLAMGNHDDRDHFLGVLKPEADAPAAVESRYVGVADAAGLRLVILDSLEMPRQVGGRLHEPQRLAGQDARRPAADADDRPGPPQPRREEGGRPHCLADAEELLAILRPRTQVKALVFGHTHTWSLRGDDGIHLVNLPAVGYPFAVEQPIGWCRLEPRADGATIAVRSVDGGPDDERHTST